MLPKIIHYCWFGRNPKPDIVKKCITSWRHFCPDYQIIEWNEENFDIQECPDFVRDAYTNKKWAFVSDYARLKIIFENGGVYLDTDVELVKPLDRLIAKCPHGYMGFEQDTQVNTGIGFAAEKSNRVIAEMMTEYEKLQFNSDCLDKIACPIINTNVLVRHGLKTGGEMQQIGDLIILPLEYLCPESMYTGQVTYTENTVSVHHYSASWMPVKERIRMKAIIVIKKLLPQKSVENIRKKLSTKNRGH
jgi:hypothetical protein